MTGYEAGFGRPHVAMLISLVAVVALAGSAGAQYWFQTGVRGSTSSAFNNGASVQIETVSPQNTTGYGSYGFWTGETLDNGAFVQVGYEVPNATGYYPTNCTASGACSGQVYLQANMPTWFWEYFPSGYTGSSFYGSVGGENSVGANGTFNTYAFNSTGNTWNFYFNGKLIGSTTLGSSSSGANPVTAFAEYAAANNNNAFMTPVEFRNLMMYTGGVYKLVPSAYAYIGYGTGSDTTLQNPYGIREVSDYTNYFEVGSGLPQPMNYTQLWNIGYTFRVDSAYGNISRVANYTAYARVGMNAPEVINVSPVERYVFSGWSGSGPGSYSGSSNFTMLTMDGNITETAIWTTQYYLNVTSQYGHAYGGGWYDANSTADFGLQSEILPVGYGKRVVFSRWSDGSTALNSSTVMKGPQNIGAMWSTQYLINVTSQYGNAFGGGWYDANSTVHVYLSDYSKQIDGTHRLEFSSWSNGMTNRSLYLTANESIMLEAIFLPQVLARFNFTDASGNQINVSYLYADGQRLNSTAFVFTGRNYTIESAVYDGINISSNATFRLAGPGTVNVGLPIYSVTILTTNIFGKPLNTTVNLSFKNGSTYSSSLGINGSVTFQNVPYGYIEGSAEYKGVIEPIHANGEAVVSIIFFTPVVIAAILVAVALVVVVVAVEIRRIKAAH